MVSKIQPAITIGTGQHILFFLSALGFLGGLGLYYGFPKSQGTVTPALIAASEEGDGPVKQQEGQEDFDLLALDKTSFQMLATIEKEKKRLFQLKEKNAAEQEKKALLSQLILTNLGTIESLEKGALKVVKEKKEESQRLVAELVKVFDVMKPQKAAEIFSKADIDTLMCLLQKMKGKKLSAILSCLSAEESARITTLLKTAALQNVDGG